MKVDIEDVLFWMDAIRNSKDRSRVLESFWKGQIKSKVWLIEQIKKYIDFADRHNIAIYGGWNGVLANLIFNSEIEVSHITSIDIDPECEEIANTVNKKYEMLGTFKAITADMCEYTVDDAEISINTSCEHITQEQYERWLSNQNDRSLIILQSNNFFELEEHIRCSTDIDEFIAISKIEVIYADTLVLPKYNRFMIIGRKNSNLAI